MVMLERFTIASLESEVEDYLRIVLGMCTVRDHFLFLGTS